MNLITKLKAVRALIELGWCQLFMALDAGHNLANPSHGEARYWCLTGAGSALSMNDGVLTRTLANALGFDGRFAMTSWNDHPDRTKQEVLDRLSNAIHRLERKAQ